MTKEMMTDKNTISLTALKGNALRLDGGAMFGNAPKALWRQWMAPDENNLIAIASTALLLQTPQSKILFETGAGAYLSLALKKRYHVEGSDHVLLSSLEKIGIRHEQITHVVLSHLHFDHAGGLLKAWENEGGSLELLFPNAGFFVGQTNFERSSAPHPRDRASFIPGLAGLLDKSGRLTLIKENDCLTLDEITIEWFESHGHTPGMVLSYIHTPGDTILVAGDLAPGHQWVNLPITMGYDRFPEGLIDEKQAMFEKVYNDKAWLFYTHDPRYAVSRLGFDKEKNRFTPDSLSTHLDCINTGI